MTKTWTAEQAKKELEAWRSSGQNIDQYARERHVPGHRLRYWKARFEQSAPGKSKSVSLLPVRMVQSAGAPIELMLPGGCVARIGRGFDEETLSRVVAVLGRR
jgi:hypothetical protein